MEELQRFQGSTFDTMARRRLVGDQDTILELTGKIQELQNKINCMNDSRDFQDAESVRSGHFHVPSQPVSFPPHPILEGMLSRSIGLPRRREGPPSIWDTHGFSGNVFANPHASSSAPYPQELNQWNSSIEEPLHSTTVEKSERPEQNQDLRCQSEPSAKNSIIFSGGDSSKNYGADQQRLQISDLHFDKFPTKIRFKTEVRTCSQFPTEAMLWIKEVEMVAREMESQLLQQNSELREAHHKSLNEMEELKKFQSSTFDTLARRRSVEDQDTILELTTGKIQELQNEINDSKDFQDAESIRSGNSHVASRPVSFPPHPIPEGMLSRSIGVTTPTTSPPLPQVMSPTS